MSLKDSLYLASKNLKQRKGKVITMISLIISMLLIVISFSFKETLFNYLYNGIMKDSSYRTVFVYYDDEIKTKEEAVVELKNINHVADAFPDTSYQMSIRLVQMGDKEFSDNFMLVGGIKGTMPDVTYGKTPEKKNEIMCPEVFFPSDNLEGLPALDNSSLLRMKKHLNEVFTVRYAIYDDSVNLDSSKVITKELVLVGTYKNNPSYLDENVCYVSRPFLDEIYEEQYEYAPEIFSNQVGSIVVIVDDIDNVKNVQDAIHSIEGYASGKVVQVDYLFLNAVKYSSYFIAIISFILSIALIGYINKKNISGKVSEVNIYRSIGYTKKNINKMLHIENMYIGVMSILIALVITLTIFFSLKYIVYLKPFIFQKVPITLSVVSIIISIIMIFAVLILTTRLYKKKILTNSIIMNIKE